MKFSINGSVKTKCFSNSVGYSFICRPVHVFASPFFSRTLQETGGHFNTSDTVGVSGCFSVCHTQSSSQEIERLRFLSRMQIHKAPEENILTHILVLIAASYTSYFSSSFAKIYSKTRKKMQKFFLSSKMKYR